ncbi:FAD-binding protein, partial [Nocardia cyriacigeorgica]|uniref:FAD-binding protein n=1 Tax=Nocardia cyriacigeorgica TaxID=135487 RepID=UPI0024581A2F
MESWAPGHRRPGGAAGSCGEENGANRGIEVRFSTPAVELITEDDAVAGVRTGDGRRLRAHGGVVLATGGFA